MVAGRRHGEQLESALLTAAWDELAEAGYARLTMASIAARARTSEAVLYRRWANKDEAVLAAIRHHRQSNPVPVPDTGTLRGDLLAYLTAVSESLAGFFAIATAAAFAGLPAGTGLTPAQVREKVMVAEPFPRTIYRRAHDRGEIDLERVPPAVLAMPFDLVRHDMLMDLKPLEPTRIRSVVDELFLPLIRRPPVQPQIVKSLTDCLRSITATQRRAAEEWVRDRDLTFEQATALEYLRRHPGAIQRDLAKMTHTTPANVSTLLKGLEHRGLVERRTEAGDERSKRVYATPAGIDRIAGFDTAMAKIAETIFAPLDEGERATLNALLARIDPRLAEL
ncbi:TetR/AcrR family transcriptional regulator C-terminal ligand-binding domain-containing protein [Amycolatopsis australiensis]|uniref:DNA-binding transcriptional regulator, MarR family n=1 Tax=Amycolatopsis australiensis TaxID=546364 RepID=A0A1K1T615_9PSEU|nr:TetR/AcrR family transcriptional regulator C-terminal ligand-binding domain-containing protein [Amycolatopsis australiensis]SFW92016.1 DNA-binding transcriptional regulator, MarR family [Amycolatopsis australiensis]